MHCKKNREWHPWLVALAGTLLVLALAQGPHARATGVVYQTVPTPTPQVHPPPLPGYTPRPVGEEGLPGRDLSLRLSVQPRDILPGEDLEYTLHVTNTSTSAALDIVLSHPLDPLLQPLEVFATQGAAEAQPGGIVIHLGDLAPRGTALVHFRARVGPSARPGQVLLHQATAYGRDLEIRSNIAAAGLPPDELPATGSDRREP